jgi:hypothetical protein
MLVLALPAMFEAVRTERRGTRKRLSRGLLALLVAQTVATLLQTLLSRLGAHPNAELMAITRSLDERGDGFVANGSNRVGARKEALEFLRRQEVDGAYRPGQQLKSHGDQREPDQLPGRRDAGHDHEGAGFYTVIVKATFTWSASGEVAPAPNQQPVIAAGIYAGEPGRSRTGVLTSPTCRPRAASAST